VLASALFSAACAMPDARLPPLPQDEVTAETRRQQIAHIRDYYGQIHRLDTVAFRLRVANLADCKKWITPQAGLYAATPDSLPRKYRSYAREALAITWARPTLLSVVEGSPAAAAGLRMGDEITAFNGEHIPTSGTMGWIAGWLVQNKLAPLQVDYRRDGEYLTTTMTPVMACAIPIELRIVDAANAETNFRKITINSGMMTLARTDAQLATIVGHEMAHVFMGHGEKMEHNMTLGKIGGTLVDGGFLLAGVSTRGTFGNRFARAGAAAYSPAFEREADYVGAYYTARAGYDLSGTEQVWYAMGQLHPDSIRFTTSHPSAPIRFVQMKKVAAEIAEKKRLGLPLDPELRPVEVSHSGETTY
jgi:hypothetical protein